MGGLWVVSEVTPVDTDTINKFIPVAILSVICLFVLKNPFTHTHTHTITSITFHLPESLAAAAIGFELINSPGGGGIG